MTSALFTEVVTLLAREKSGQDELGNDTYDWVQADSPAWVETGPGTENTQARESSTAVATVYLPLATLLGLEAVSKVVWNGREWQVAGDVGQQPGGFAVEGYQVAALERVSG